MTGKQTSSILSQNTQNSVPDWYYNILANPDMTVEVGTNKYQAHAQVAEHPERTRLYNKMVEMMPSFDDYHRKTTRVIPVIVLTPVKQLTASMKNGFNQAVFHLIKYLCFFDKYNRF